MMIFKFYITTVYVAWGFDDIAFDMAIHLILQRAQRLFFIILVCLPLTNLRRSVSVLWLMALLGIQAVLHARARG